MRNKVWLVIIFIGFACSNDSKLLQQANQISHAVKLQIAPDSREAIFNPAFSINKDNGLVVSGETSLSDAKLALFSALEALEVHLVDSLVVLPEKKLGDKTWGVINLSVVNLRAYPKHSAELVSQSIMGTPVRLLKEDNGWYQIQTPDKYIAWVDGAAIAQKTESEMKAWRNSTRIIFIPDFEVVKDPGQNEVVTDLVAGAILEVEKENQNSYDLSLPDGRKIQVEKSNCELLSDWKTRKLKDASILTKTAKQFLGRPYLWGGTSVKGVDCSGFVKSVYFINGIILARDASLQFLHGDTISPGQGFLKLAEGDLIFFGRAKTDEKPMKVTHVGMYMRNGEYIHSSGRVRINSFEPEAENYNNYRSITWLGGRRVLSRIGEPGICRVSDHPWY
ncbi:SH3 domain-containing protein [Labilibaculum sp. A4]|uniref:SH3 domain-containing C40 family peptidase n=1 Tax=Labilibaculum euxinus TaxID=2686357 RepID=UPI000F620A78|nr:SH3 domain-containing C40 family peptidase [Labilibaculum euxinus]MDQ1772263.1 SH3 domain-containing C40 family peptidase [Labilibaculum euxinus]MWN78039.1 SH3 domain-containing protein [Labilibaculum euxinus]